MTAPILNPSIASYQWNDQKIEYFVKDVNAKNRLRNALVPMPDLRRISRPKVAPAFVLDIVEQFSEGLRQKGYLFARSSFWDLLLPFSQAIEYLVMHGPERIVVQITNTPSIYIFAEIRDRNFHFDLHFNEETGKFEEAVVNVFLHKAQKLNVFGSIEEVLTEIENYLNLDMTPEYEYPLYSIYRILKQTYSSFAF